MFQTDDPQFDALRAQHQTRYGVSIAYIKSRVEPGTEYANEVARAVVSPSGGYFELAEMPEEFAGAKLAAHISLCCAGVSNGAMTALRYCRPVYLRSLLNLHQIPGRYISRRITEQAVQWKFH